MMRPMICAFAAFCAIALTSCTGTPRGWQKAKSTAWTDPVSGAWAGEWRSVPTGHHGRLRCVAVPAGDGKWKFRFRASWAKILCAGYTIECEARPAPEGGWTVTGSRDLGKIFGGEFTHRAVIRGDHYSAEYESSRDRGSMTMHRVRSPDRNPQ